MEYVRVKEQIQRIGIKKTVYHNIVERIVKNIKSKKQTYKKLYTLKMNAFRRSTKICRLHNILYNFIKQRIKV